MKIVAVDQFEFENSSTEESVEIAVGKMTEFPFPTVSDFVASRIGVEASTSLPTPTSFDQSFGSHQAREHLLKFANISLPDACSWQTYSFSEGPDEWALVICAPDQFIHYQWGTSA